MYILIIASIFAIFIAGCFIYALMDMAYWNKKEMEDLK